jgi:hypothetical protein
MENTTHPPSGGGGEYQLMSFGGKYEKEKRKGENVKEKGRGQTNRK